MTKDKPVIAFAPFSKKRTDGKRNAKDFPYWEDVVSKLSDRCDIIQFAYGSETPLVKPDSVLSNMPLHYIEHFVTNDADMFLCVDNYMQHLGHYVGKKGVVVYAQSDPRLFGYPENVNLYRDPMHFRKNQFLTWNQCDFSAEAFPSVAYVVGAVLDMLKL